MISFRRYGYRMMGNADALLVLQRARYLGQPLFSGPSVSPGASAFGGELAPSAPAAPPPVRIVSVRAAPLPTPARVPPPTPTPGAPPPPNPPPMARPFVPAPRVSATFAPQYLAPAYVPPDTTSYDAGGCPDCPPAGYSGGQVAGAVVLGGAAGSLIMYVIGLLSRENKRRRRK